MYIGDAHAAWRHPSPASKLCFDECCKKGKNGRLAYIEEQARRPPSAQTRFSDIRAARRFNWPIPISRTAQ